MEKKHKIIRNEEVFSGFLKMRRYHLQHTSFHGGWCGEVMRERLEGLAAVAVLLYDPQRDLVVLVEQFRIGLMGQSDPPWSIETVSGFCDTLHETPEEVARREVVEETGCSLKALTHIGEFIVSPGISVERVNLYCGRVDADGVEGIYGLEHEGEEMRAVVMPRSQAFGELFGRLNTTPLIISLQWLEANHSRVVAEWGRVADTGG
jgi:ADP-ribose pyrophosphatase